MDVDWGLHPRRMQRFQGQGSSPPHSSDNAGSLTHGATREPKERSEFPWFSKMRLVARLSVLTSVALSLRAAQDPGNLSQTLGRKRGQLSGSRGPAWEAGGGGGDGGWGGGEGEGRSCGGSWLSARASFPNSGPCLLTAPFLSAKEADLPTVNTGCAQPGCLSMCRAEWHFRWGTPEGSGATAGQPCRSCPLSGPAEPARDRAVAPTGQCTDLARPSGAPGQGEVAPWSS